ncbi:MAG: carboxyl transferase [Lachnospiraceae bacterium]|jgi:acetyl-CoA carboxylase carboxyltransferase component|nr:carboxyl transferase [Lachnospiraceae bacterium]
MGNATTENAARKRIDSLLDAGSFVEIGSLVTARSTDFNLSETPTPSDGVITGYGIIDGKLVYVYSQDKSVLGGAIGEMHARKICRIYELALKTGAPVIGLIDSAGLRLQEATDALEALGEIYLKQTLASGVIPQITAIFGNCGGGLALLSGLSDFVFIEKDNGKLFLNSSNAIETNKAGKDDYASADFQSKESSLVDGVGTETEIFGYIRTLVSLLPSNNEEDGNDTPCNDDLNRKCAGIDALIENSAAILTTISDNYLFWESKRDFAPEMVTGFMKLDGMTVGAIANKKSGELTVHGAMKAVRFVSFCDAFQIPIITLTNVSGFEASVRAEKVLARATARLAFSFANATVPKINVLIGEAFGSSYLVMNSKKLGADIVYAWENAKIGMMDAKAASRIIYPDADNALLNEKASEYDTLQNSALSAARRGYVDAVISPEDTRKHLIASLEMLFTKREDRPAKKHGCV